MGKIFNWGFGIAAALVLFAMFLVSIIVFFSFQNFDLVSEDYYDKEIAYQEQIDKMKRARELPENLKIIKEAAVLKLSFPKIFHNDSITGKIHFYRADDAKKDFSMPVRPDSNNIMHLPSAGMDAGLWKIQVEWQAGGESYYYEEKVVI